MTYPKIDSMNKFGIVVIKFDRLMAIGDLSNDNLPIVAMLVPGPETNAGDVLLEKVELVSYESEGTITLKFDFKFPLRISSNDIPD